MYAYLHILERSKSKNVSRMGWDKIHLIESVYCVSYIGDHDFELD